MGRWRVVIWVGCSLWFWPWAASGLELPTATLPGVFPGSVTATPTTPLPSLTTADSSTTDLREVSCLVEPSMDIQLGTPVEGFLEEVNVDRGDVVTPGQVLARLNSGVEQAAVDTQAAKVQFGQRRKTRTNELHQKNMIADQEVDNITTEWRLAELEWQERNERLKLRTLLSPVKGVIVDRYHSLGDLIKQERVFRIAKIDVLHVEAVLPARLFGLLSVGQSYEVQLPLLKQSRSAKVSVVDRVIDAGSGTFRVRLLLPNQDNTLPAGIRCRIDFPASFRP